MARSYIGRLVAALATVALVAGCGSMKPAAPPRGAVQTTPPVVTAQPSAPAAETAPAPAVAAPAMPAPAPMPASAASRPGADGAYKAGDHGAAPAGSVPGSPPAVVRDAAGQQRSPLRAGETDDNARFDEYLGYLSQYRGKPVLPVDVSERYLITVRDGLGRPVHDARVDVFARGRAVFSGLTYANGQVPFFPRSVQGLDREQSFQVRLSRGRASGEFTLLRGPDVLPYVLDVDRQQEVLNLDLLFLIDTTGSMGDEIDALRAALQSIVRQVDALQPRPRLRLGMVLYRDRGDEYITKVYDFTEHVQDFAGALAQVQARGGGDYPESLNEGLYRALNNVSWRSREPALRMVFLLADAPPHLDYAQDHVYTDLMAQAVRQGVKIFPLAASGLDAQGEYIFRQLGQFSMGRFIFLTYQQGNGGAPGDSTVHNVSDYDVSQLDDLIVRLVANEVAHQAP